MDISQDYDNDGNNIVPCPICLSQFCPSKEGGKCPEEDDYKRAVETKDAPDPITASRERIEEEFEKLEALDRYNLRFNGYLEKFLLQHEAVMLEHIPVGALRQWINEDLLKTGHKLVTDDDIRAFLKVSSIHPTI